MAAHSCIMCRDYRAIDNFASTLSLINIKRTDPSQPFAKEKNDLFQKLNDINNKDRVGQLQSVRATLKNLQESLTQPNADHSAIGNKFNTLDAQRIALEAQDNTAFVAFVIKFLDLAYAKDIIAHDDHVGRARLFCAWIAASITYEYSQERISADGVTPSDSIRAGKEFCAGYASLFVSMFNAVITERRVLMQVTLNFVAREILGETKSYSTAATATRKPNGIDGHAWATFPSSADAAGDPATWKVVDPCWFQYQRDPPIFQSQWFYNSNLTILRTHHATGARDRLPPNALQVTTDQFANTDLAPFTDYSLSLNIEESSLVPQNYTLTAAAQQAFQFSLLCVGIQPLPVTLWAVPFKDGKGYNNYAVQFAAAAPAPAGPNLPIVYAAALNTAAVAHDFNGSGFEVHIAVPFGTVAGAPPMVATPAVLGAMNSATIRWEGVAVYKVAGAHPLI